ncbi:MAG: hypothetical protein ACOH2A_12620 [Sphingobacteriaceae bacterium]
MKSNNLKAVKKELAKSISDKFLEVIKSLGHDAEKLKREIKKAGRFVAKKIERKEKDKVKKVKKVVNKPIKAVEKTEQKVGAKVKVENNKVKKVIAQATKTTANPASSKSVAKPVPKIIADTVKAVSSKENSAKESLPKEISKKPTTAAPKTNQKKQPVKHAVNKKAD